MDISHAVRFIVPAPVQGIKPDNSCALVVDDYGHVVGRDWGRDKGGEPRRRAHVWRGIGAADKRAHWKQGACSILHHDPDVPDES